MSDHVQTRKGNTLFHHYSSETPNKFTSAADHLLHKKALLTNKKVAPIPAVKSSAAPAPPAYKNEPLINVTNKAVTGAAVLDTPSFMFAGKKFKTGDILWNTDNFVSFGSGNAGIYLGATPRIIDSVKMQTYQSNNYSITKLNVNQHDKGGQSDFAVRLLRETIGLQRQYVEVTVTTWSSVNGMWNITLNGKDYLNTFGAGFKPEPKSSFYLESDSTGTKWLLQTNATIPV
jgi:hypothetical protein